MRSVWTFGGELDRRAGREEGSEGGRSDFVVEYESIALLCFSVVESNNRAVPVGPRLLAGPPTSTVPFDM